MVTIAYQVEALMVALFYGASNKVINKFTQIVPVLPNLPAVLATTKAIMKAMHKWVFIEAENDKSNMLSMELHIFLYNFHR